MLSTVGANDLYMVQLLPLPPNHLLLHLSDIGLLGLLRLSWKTYCTLTKVDAQCDKLMTVVSQTKLTILATVDILRMTTPTSLPH